MKIRILQLAFAIVFSFCAYAQTTVWNPAANENTTGNWNEAENWTEGIPNPGSGKAVFTVEDAIPVIVTDEQEVFQMVQGDNGPGGEIIVKNGGSLTTGEVWSGIGYNAPAELTVERGGRVTFGQHMWIGFQTDGEGNQSEGIVNINGGTIAVTQMTGLGWNGGIGKVYLRDGLWDLANINPDGLKSVGEGSLIDISGGLMTINGNRLAHTDQDGNENPDQIMPFIEEKRLTALGGNADIQYWYNEESDETYITAPAVIESIFPEDAAIEVSRDSDIQVVFNKKMDAGSVAENLTVSPELGDQALVWSATGDTLTITGDLEDGVTYAIEVSKDAIDLYGFQLAYDESFSFTVEGEIKIILNSEELLNPALNLYPNPTSDFFSFGTKMDNVQIYNLGGRLIYSAKNIDRVSVKNLSQGQYLVKALIGNESVTRRLLINK